MVRPARHTGASGVADLYVLDDRAFFMATMRFAELRHIGDRAVAAAYRHSFAYNTEARLLVSMLFYATACALFAGIFIVRLPPRVDSVRAVRRGLFAYYLSLGLEPDSAAQNLKPLYRHRGFVLYLVICFAVFSGADVHRDPGALHLVQTSSRQEPRQLWRTGLMLRFAFASALLIIGAVQSVRGPFYILLFYLFFAYFRPETWIWTGEIQR
jgi:hypothetical protein